MKEFTEMGGINAYLSYCPIEINPWSKDKASKEMNNANFLKYRRLYLIATHAEMDTDNYRLTKEESKRYYDIMMDQGSSPDDPDDILSQDLQSEFHILGSIQKFQALDALAW